MCEQAIQNQTYSAAEKTCLTQLQVARDDNSPNASAELQLLLGKIAFRLSKVSLADTYFQKVKLSKEFASNVTVQYLWYRLVGQKYYSQQLLAKAKEHFYQGLAIAKQEQNLIWLSKSYNDMGLAELREQNFTSAINFLKQSLALKLEQNDHYKIGTSYYNLGVLHVTLEEPLQAINYLELAVQHYRIHSNGAPKNKKVLASLTHTYEDLAEQYQLNREQEKANLYNQLVKSSSAEDIPAKQRARKFEYLAREDIKQNKLLSATLLLEQSTYIQQREGIKLSPGTISTQAKLYYIEGKTNKAITILTQAVNDFERHELSDVHNAFYLQLSQYSKLTNPEKALAYYEQYQKNRELFLSKKYQTELKSSQHQLAIQQVERELIEQKLMNVSQQSKNHQLLNYALMLGTLLLLITGLVIRYVLNKQREKKAFLAQIEYHKQQLALLEMDGEIDVDKEDTDQDKPFNTILVESMIDALAIWEKHTGMNKIELAEKSGIWTISIDNGNLRTRSLDKYLSVDKIPKKPKWRNVVRTNHFLLSDESLPSNDRVLLDNKLSQIMANIKAQSLDVCH